MINAGIIDRGRPGFAGCPKLAKADTNKYAADEAHGQPWPR